jgi:endonuclease/exonuclease/phosphatase family metal-dependent hydrolase
LKKFSKNILQFLNAITLFALCLSYLSNYINPIRLSIVAFFGLAFQYLYFINIGFLLFWLWRKNKFAVYGLIVIVLGIGYTGRYLQLRSHEPIDNISESIKILSYNVRIFNYFEWEGKGSNRDSIVAYMNSENPDIICLQEFFTRSDDSLLSENHIRKRLNSYPNFHIEYSFIVDETSSKFGVATFSKFPIIHRGNIQFGNSTNTCIYSDILIETDTFRVYNTHLQSISLKKDNYALMDSIFYINSKKIDEVKDVSSRLKRAYIARAKQTKAIVNHMKTSPYPVILCGDFNDTPVSYAYHKLLGNKKDAYRESGSGFGNTYRGKLPSFRIDYIFYSDHFTSYNYKTHKIPLSDHYPVTTQLVLKR